MPRNDDFEQFEQRYTDEVEVIVPDNDDADELAAARELVRRADERLAGKVDVGTKPGNRKTRRTDARKRPAAIPAGAPKPQDHKPKKSEQQAEAEGEMYRITLWGEDFDVDPNVFTRSIDFMQGRVERDVMMMVRGILGEQAFVWFMQRARVEGLDGLDASQKVMDLVNAEIKGNR